MNVFLHECPCVCPSVHMSGVCMHGPREDMGEGLADKDLIMGVWQQGTWGVPKLGLIDGSGCLDWWAGGSFPSYLRSLSGSCSALPLPAPGFLLCAQAQALYAGFPDKGHICPTQTRGQPEGWKPQLPFQAHQVMEPGLGEARRY